MELLSHGVDRSVIALWLGHESVKTTQMYLHADLRLKEQALSHVTPLGVILSRYRPEDHLLASWRASDYAGPSSIACARSSVSPITRRAGPAQDGTRHDDGNPADVAHDRPGANRWRIEGQPCGRV